MAYLGVTTQDVTSDLQFQFNLPVDHGAYVVAVTPHDRGLVMYTLHHAAEIRSMDTIEELGAIPTKVKPQEVQLAKAAAAASDPLALGADGQVEGRDCFIRSVSAV